ncbi:hypothetical protein TNIN_463341 [Trichonephila inaurata madagascariensis]|uniref:Uncharacterized protein n=1 Tax=Trichonephila inaurata madagascariensis TaxID=2747483 RepID=A0A8X6Y5T7_9ARAC|nr:hypothetical protein TNIN_463341 [Trichonephila inaurata madagascariensis]
MYGFHAIPSTLPSHRPRASTDHGVSTTRIFLLAYLFFAFLGILAAFLLPPKTESALAGIFYSIAGVSLLVFLGRIIQYYRFLRRLRESGAPLDQRNLSFKSYLCKIFCPCKCSSSETPQQNETQNLEMLERNL